MKLENLKEIAIFLEPYDFPGLWWHPGLSYCQGPCLGPCTYNSQGLHLTPCRCPGSGLQPVAVLVCEGHTISRAMQIRVSHTVTQGHGIIWAWTAEDHVWVSGPTTWEMRKDGEHACCNPRALLVWPYSSLALKDLSLPHTGSCSGRVDPDELSWKS